MNVGVYDDRTTSCEHKRMHTAVRRGGPYVKYDEMWYCEKYRYSDYVDMISMCQRANDVVK